MKRSRHSFLPGFLPGFLLSVAALSTACSSTSVQTFGSPEEATEAMVEAAASGDSEEALRIFETFGRSSVQRDRVYATMFDAAEDRYSSGRGGEAAGILGFLSEQYPSSIATREALVYALFVDRAETGEASDESTRAIEAAVKGVRDATPTPSAWVDLAASQAAIDRGDLDDARREFRNFRSVWDGRPAAVVPYVEDIERYLVSH